MADKYYQSIGRRKTAIAQVRLYPGGKGTITVNGREIKSYFTVERLHDTAIAPLKEVGRLESVDVTIKTIGGGLTGQADAVKLGLTRALIKEDETVKTTLKAQGFCTRDARKKERKKFGLRGARRAPQWRKR